MTTTAKQQQYPTSTTTTMIASTPPPKWRWQQQGLRHDTSQALGIYISFLLFYTLLTYIYKIDCIRNIYYLVVVVVVMYTKLVGPNQFGLVGTGSGQDQSGPV
jgi:hypothetical protein